MGLTAAQSSRQREEAETVGVILSYIRDPNAENVQLALEQPGYELHRSTYTRISFTKYLLQYYIIRCCEIADMERRLSSYRWISDCSGSAPLTSALFKGPL